MNKPEFITRTITGFFIGAITLGAIIYSPWSYLAWLCLIVWMGTHEYFRLEKNPSSHILPLLLPSCFVLITGAVGYMLINNANILCPLLVLVILPSLLFFGSLLTTRDADVIIQNQKSALNAVAYLALPVLSGCIFLVGGYTYKYLLVPVLLIWLNDVGAYMIGSFLGKTKIAPEISPGKSVEGTIGGGVMVLLTGLLLWKVWPEIPFGYIAVLSITTPFFALAGDLWESLLKRKAGVKDSGKILPGHGGMLDRYDSLLFVLPIAALAYFIFAL